MTLEVKDIPFFHDLGEAELKLLSACLIEKSFKKGDMIHNEGSGCTVLFFIKSGRVKVYRTSSEGRDQIYEILGPGDTCACNPGEISWHCGSNAEAVSDSVVWFLPREKYVRLIQDSSQLTHSLNTLLAKRLQCFSNIIEEVSLKDSRKRLVKYLLDMLDHKKVSGNNVIFIPFTREEIAQRLGTARETVARQLSDLKKKKLIDIKPYQIIIRDREKLQKLLD